MPIKLVINELIKAEELTVNRAMWLALRKSSGKYTKIKLAKLGHPYSVRNIGGTIPYNDPGKINIQSGEFYLAWKRMLPTGIGDSLQSGITNTAPYADKLAKGIPGLTIPRPLIETIIPTVEYWRKRNLVTGIRNAIQPD